MVNRSRLVWIPLSLTALRAALAPVVIFLALVEPHRSAFGICLCLALVSDIFDGVIARRLGVATPALRRMDSVADSTFYAAATYAVWHLYPYVLRENAAALMVLAALEAARYVYDFAKFKREASYHMWSSKLWGLALFLSFFSVLSLGVVGTLVSATIYFGIAVDIEGILISWVMPHWQSDVPSLLHAWRLRKVPRPI